MQASAQNNERRKSKPPLTQNNVVQWTVMSTMCNYLTPPLKQQIKWVVNREGGGWWKYNRSISPNTTSFTTRTSEKYIFSFITPDAALCHCSTVTLERKGTGTTAMCVCVLIPVYVKTLSWQQTFHTLLSPENVAPVGCQGRYSSQQREVS